MAQGKIPIRCRRHGLHLIPKTQKYLDSGAGSRHELGFTCTDAVLRLPFSFDADLIAEAYPDLRKPMLTFEKTSDKLLKANEHIDTLVMGMVPVRDKSE